MGDDRAAGRKTLRYQFSFDTKFKNENTILLSYLGVINVVDDDAQNLTQTYTVWELDHRTGDRRKLGMRLLVPPNNQGIATPFYNQGNNGENPAKDGVAPGEMLDAYTAQTVHALSDDFRVFAGQRDDGFYADIQAVFDLLQLRSPAQDAQGGFNVHTIALDIPIDVLGGDMQIVGVYATTSRRQFSVLSTKKDPRLKGDFVQVGRQGNPLFNEAFVAIADKDRYSRTSPTVDEQLFGHTP